MNQLRRVYSPKVWWELSQSYSALPRSTQNRTSLNDEMKLFRSARCKQSPFSALCWLPHAMSFSSVLSWRRTKWKRVKSLSSTLLKHWKEKFCWNKKEKWILRFCWLFDWQGELKRESQGVKTCRNPKRLKLFKSSFCWIKMFLTTLVLFYLFVNLHVFPSLALMQIQFK